MFKSATKVVLILMVLGLLAFTYLGKVDSETFKLSIVMVLSFYFGQKITPTPTV